MRTFCFTPYSCSIPPLSRVPNQVCRTRLFRQNRPIDLSERGADTMRTTGINWTLLLSFVALLVPATTSGHDPKEKTPHVEQARGHMHATVPPEYAKQSAPSDLW